MEPLKEMFSQKFYERLAVEFKNAHQNFHPEKFVKDALSGNEERTLIQRMRNTSLVLNRHLPSDYKNALSIILEVAPQFSSHFTSFLFPDYVSVFGLNDPKRSLEALKVLTSYGTSEFAVREFLRKDLNGTMKYMYKWSQDENHHVRRLASEGSRPRLPWSFNLEMIARDPEITRPILESLKADQVLYVKKSVANHLNDFSRISPDWMLKVVKGWDKNDPHTAWIVRHASRTLIKQGHPGSLRLFNYEKNIKIKASGLTLEPSRLKLGEALSFSFQLQSEGPRTQKLVVDYAIRYAKGSGKSSRKVFKLKELSLGAEEKVRISKKQSFKELSTRKHYAGAHTLEILVNGQAVLKKDFQLTI